MADISEGFKKRLSEPLSFHFFKDKEEEAEWDRKRAEENKAMVKYIKETYGIDLDKRGSKS